MNEIPPSMAMVPLILGHCAQQLEELSKSIDDMHEGLELNRLTTEVSKMKARFETYDTKGHGKYGDPARYLQ